jgi:hypothetical protein
VRTIITALLAAGILTFESIVAAAHAQAGPKAACPHDCKPASKHIDASARAKPKRQSKVTASLPATKRQRPSLPWRLYQQATAFVARLSPELVSGLVYVGVILVRVIGAARHSRNLRIIKQLHCRANALECQAADLRAEAERRHHRR